MSLTYMLRSRPDGQIELLQFDPRVVGVFPLKADAERVQKALEHADTLAPPVLTADMLAPAHLVGKVAAGPLASCALSAPDPVEPLPPPPHRSPCRPSRTGIAQ